MGKNKKISGKISSKTLITIALTMIVMLFIFIGYEGLLLEEYNSVSKICHNKGFDSLGDTVGLYYCIDGSSEEISYLRDCEFKENCEEIDEISNEINRKNIDKINMLIRGDKGVRKK